MTATDNRNIASKQGAEDSGRYFKYMSEFVGFAPDDADTILQTKPIIEKHLPEIVAKFYTHLLRYPPTRQWFLKDDGTIDQDYVELRMRHLTNFWLRTASGVFDDEYARYVDYVGRAHTSHGADPRIYIAERYVIGQVGFMQHAISEVLIKELSSVDEDLCLRAEEAWDNLMMVLLEMLSRAYGTERTAEPYDALLPVDRKAVEELAAQAFEHERGGGKPIEYKKVRVARAADVLDGERKIVTVDGVSIGVFHHKGKWYALRNSCLHRGGPVCTGTLVDDTLTCPWHGFQYDVTTGKLLVDPNARLDSYPVFIDGDDILLQVPDINMPPSSSPEAASTTPQPAAESGGGQSMERELQDNEFFVSDIPAGTALRVGNVAVYNVGGAFYATADECTHQLGPMHEGQLEGTTIECPWHGSRFDVRTGQVLRGPAKVALQTYQVTIEGEIGRVELTK